MFLWQCHYSNHLKENICRNNTRYYTVCFKRSVVCNNNIVAIRIQFLLFRIKLKYTIPVHCCVHGTRVMVKRAQILLKRIPVE